MNVSKYLFTTLLTLITISGTFNYILYSEMVNKSELLVKSEQNERLAIDKNKSLSETIESLEISRIENQKITDEMNIEISELNKKSQKTVTIIKEAIKNDSCYDADINYPDSIGLHYDKNGN